MNTKRADQTEELEAQVSARQEPARSASSTMSAPSYPDITAQSPTAFLEMLSSAATDRAPAQQQQSGVRPGAQASTTTLASTPNFANWGPVRPQGDMSAPSPMFTFSGSTQVNRSQDASRQNSQRGSESSASNTASVNASAAPAILSPNGVFNFSPGPTGMTPGQNGNNQWPPMPPNGQLEPSTRIEGPWRAVETVETFVAGNSQSGNEPLTTFSGVILGQDQLGGDAATALVNDEALQQQLLMDLFWPGWPPCLPEPHIVNDL